MDHHRILSWADRRLKALEASLYDFWDKDVYSVVPEHQLYADGSATTRAIVHLKHPEGVPIPEDWVFEIGDIAHNLRVSLDYLAFRIITRRDANAPAKQIAFPICDSPGSYRTVTGRCLPGNVQDVRDAIELLQPYPGTTATNADRLWTLHELDNVHKHRYLLSADPSVHDVQCTVVNDVGNNITIVGTTIPQGPLRDRTEVARFRFANVDDRRGYVETRVRCHVLFDKSGPGNGRPVVTVLKEIGDHIRDSVIPDLEKNFLK